jgi:hypothetical protein
MDDLDYCMKLGRVEFGDRKLLYFPIHKVPCSLGELGVEHDRHFMVGMGTFEEVCLNELHLGR